LTVFGTCEIKAQFKDACVDIIEGGSICLRKPGNEIFYGIAARAGPIQPNSHNYNFLVIWVKGYTALGIRTSCN
jgi:hypothetical protein